MAICLVPTAPHDDIDLSNLSDTSGAVLQTYPRTMRFGSTAKVLAKCMLKYYRIPECLGSAAESVWVHQLQAWQLTFPSCLYRMS